MSETKQLGQSQLGQLPAQQPDASPGGMPATSWLDPSIPPLVPAGPRQKISGDAEWNALAPGTEFEGPDGKPYIKPWVVNSDQDFEAVPEGQKFIGPDRQPHVKQRFEPLDMATQTLYDMATNDREREKALQRALPPSTVAGVTSRELAGRGPGVKRNNKGELYVELPDGRLLKPGRGLSAVAGTLLSSAPVVGGAVGAFAGGTAGSAVPGAGTAGGALAGAAGGAMLGKAFNDMTLALAGIYDRSAGEEALGLAGEGALSAGGEATGGVIGAAWPSVKYGLQAGKDVLPSTLAYFLGATQSPKETLQALRLAQAGAKPRPSRWATESPYLGRLVEQFDPIFRQWNPLDRANIAYYEREAGQLLERPEIGVLPFGRQPLTSAEYPVSVKPAGEAMLNRVTQDLAAKDAVADAARDAAIKAAQSTAFGREAELSSRLSILEAAERDATQAAQMTVDAGFSEIAELNQRALAAANAGRHPGDLWRQANERLDRLHASFTARAGREYDKAYQIAGNTPLIYTGMQAEAQRMLEQLPLEFQGAYPTMLRELERFRGNEPLTLEWAHNLRKLARARTDRAQLHGDLFEGQKRKIAGMLNRMMHDPAQPMEVQQAVRKIDEVDRFYDQNAATYRQKAIETLTDQERLRYPGDRQKVAELIFDDESSAARDMVRNKLGPDLWRGVVAADLDRVVASSRNLLGEIDANRFARQVTERLTAPSGGGSAKWRTADLPPRTQQLALQVQALQGKIPLEKLPGDNVATMLQRALDYSAEAKILARERPMETLQDEIKLIQQQHAADVAQARRDEPMAMLTDPAASNKLIEVTNHILDTPDLIVTAAQRFGFNSDEFNTLRRVAVHRLMQREQPGTLLREVAGSRGRGGMPEEVQRLLFPGGTRDDLLTIAHDMEFLMHGGRSDVGSSMAAGGRVLHPATDQDLPLAWLNHLPFGAGFAARAIRGKFYAFITDNVMTNPKFIAYVARGLRSGPQGRLAARQAVQNAIQTGRFVGAAAATSLPEIPERERRPVPSGVPWRQLPSQPLAPRRNPVRGDISPLVRPDYALSG